MSHNRIRIRGYFLTEPRPEHRFTDEVPKLIRFGRIFRGGSGIAHPYTEVLISPLTIILAFAHGLNPVMLVVLLLLLYSPTLNIVILLMIKVKDRDTAAQMPLWENLLRVKGHVCCFTFCMIVSSYLLSVSPLYVFP